MIILIFQVIAGWMLADFISGIVHAAGDSERLGSTRVMKVLATFNEDHHKEPLAIVSKSFASRGLSTWIGTAIIGSLWWLSFGPSALWLSMVIGGLMVPEVHRWAHAPSKAPWIVRKIQKTGIFQSPKHHARHHRPPHDVRFCVLTNYVNPFFDLVMV